MKRDVRFYIRFCLGALFVPIGYTVTPFIAIMPPFCLLVFMTPLVILGNGFMALVSSDSNTIAKAKWEVKDAAGFWVLAFTWPILLAKQFIYEKKL